MFGTPGAPLVTLTDSAAQHAKSLIDQSTDGKNALRVGVKARGCSGMSYFVEYADEPKKFEEVIEHKGVRIFIDPAATMFLVGAEMDYVDETFQTGFVFSNPNEKGRCGCGESFHV